MADEFITLEAASKRLGVHWQTVRTWIKAGKLQAFKQPQSGLKVFVKSAEVAALAKERVEFQPLLIGESAAPPQTRGRKIQKKRK